MKTKSTIIERNIAFVRDAFDALMRGDTGPLLAALTEDAVIGCSVAEGTPLSGHFQGREGYLRYLQTVAEVLEPLSVELGHYTGSESCVVLLGRERARVRKTGKVADREYASVVNLRDGKIARVWTLSDLSSINDAYRTGDGG